MEEARNVPAGTPTWTGQFGQAGRPDAPRGSQSTRGARAGGARGGGRGGGAPSSTSILNNLAIRQGRLNPTALASASSSSSSSSFTPSSSSRSSTPAQTTPQTFRGRRMLEM